MSLTVGIDPPVLDLLSAIGLLDGDGRADPSWFDDPLARAGTVLSDPHQRAALLRLLEEMLPAAPGLPGWHPLVEHESGAVYLTVTGDLIGIAAALHATVALGDGEATVRGSLALPLVTVAGELRAVAGTAEGPVRLGVDVVLDGVDAPLTGFGAALTVDVDAGAGVTLELTGVDLGAGPVDLQLDGDDLGADVVDAVRALLAPVLAAFAGGTDRAGRAAMHLFALLGSAAEGIPPLPLDDLFADPATALDWLATIATDPDALTAWGRHLGGLIGADLPVTGLGTAAEPVRAPLLGVDGARLDLLLAPGEDGATLRIGLELAVPAGAARLDAGATVFEVPLRGDGATRVLPDAAVLVGSASPPLPGADPHVESLRAGLRLRDGQVEPVLLLSGVRLGGTDHGDLDLTDADQVTGAVGAQVETLLTDAFGAGDQARALLALLGLETPAADPSSRHTHDAPTLLADPLGALRTLHRAVLADDEHTWGPLLGELATLLDLPSDVDGRGTVAAPWTVPIDADGTVRLYLATWNARDAATPDGEQRLRIGLLARAESPPFDARWLAELLAVDLPAADPARVDLVGRQTLDLRVAPLDPVRGPGGLELGASAVEATATWRPGEPLTARLRVVDLVVRDGGQVYGPVSPTLPTSEPDLGLGPVAVPVLRRLTAQALHAFGGDAAYVLGSLLGLHRGLPSLPEGWPLLEPPDGGGLDELLDDPVRALRDVLHGLATRRGPDGAPLAERALRTVGALLRSWETDDGSRPAVDVTVTGDGTPERPWAIAPADGLPSDPELLTWLEPAGPPAELLSTLADVADAVTDGASLTALLRRLAAAHTALADRLVGRADADLGAGLDALAAWLHDGDGVVPLAAQLPSGPNWTHGDVVPVAHQLLPRDAGVVGQVAAQLAAWAAVRPGRPAVLVAPDGGWDALLAAIDPAHPAGARFDLRAVPDPRDVDLGRVIAVAAAYTADLLAGAAQDEQEQLERVVRRVRELTGAADVVLVAHSTSGRTARALAAAHPELVSGLVTLGTPHGGTSLLPLTDDAVAATLRVLATVTGPLTGSATGDVLAQLTASLDGRPGPLGPALAAAAVPAPVIPPGEAVPGLAIGSALGGDVVGLLAGAAVGAVAALPEVAPTHVAFGLRARPSVPAAGAGEIALDVRVRLALGRVALVANPPEPPRPATGVSVELDARRPGGWLLGTETPVAPGPAVRRIEAGLTVAPGAPGSVEWSPWLRLHDTRSGPLSGLDDPALAPLLDAVLTALRDGGTDAAHLLGFLDAAGLVRDTADGPRTDLAALADLTAAPTRALSGARAALLAALREVVDPLLVDLGRGVQLSLDPDAGELRLRTTDAIVLAEPLRAELDLTLDAATMTPRVTGAVTAGAAELRIRSTTDVTLAIPPWLDPLPLAGADPAAIGRALGARLPRTALSAVVSLLLGPHTTAAVGPVDLLVTDPAAWLRGAAALGDGGRLDPSKIGELLRTVAEALGVDAADGIALPGGYRLRVEDADPPRLVLSGTLGDGDTTLDVDVAAELPADGPPTVGGTVTVAVPLGGDWGPIAVGFSLERGTVGLVVTTANTGPIRLLPSVDGIGVLLTGAAALLPRALQAIADGVAASPVRDGALAVAEALGVYGDPGGFETPERVERLRSLLTPGWLATQVADPGAVVDAAVTLLTSAAVTPPAGHQVTRSGDRLVWSATVDGVGRLSAEIGWEGGAPVVLLGLDGLDAGPVVVVEARLGIEGGAFTGRLLLGVDAGPDLAFFAPQVETGVTGRNLSVRVLPLGTAAADDLRVDLVPTPGVTVTAEGAARLVQDWMVPLAVRFLLPVFRERLPEALWDGGPSAQKVLEDAGLVQPGVSPPAPRGDPPPLAESLLRALAALATGTSVALPPDLTLSAAAEGGRYGLRLRGTVTVPAGDVDVVIRFGPDGDGVTAWVLRDDATAEPPFALDPQLVADGLGVLLDGPGGAPLVRGPIEVGGVGGLVWFTATFLEAGSVKLAVERAGAGVEIADARLAIGGGDGDAFVAAVLPPEVAAPFSVVVSYRDGELAVTGGLGAADDGVAITVPLAVDVAGVLRISELFLSATAGAGRAEVVAAISGGASLGPLSVAVTRVGLRVVVDGSGAHLAFKPPNGFGLSMDTAAVRVGGFLLVDEARGRYVGALELALLEQFSLSALGVVTTRRPDGSPGFSLLMLVTTTFPVPLPIGFGFFLTGAGGLLGLNRGMDLDRIRTGLRTGTADSILFPTDVVRRIDTILRDLEESFPPADGHFLVAPMVALQWLTPPLVTAKLGLVLEIANPPRIAVLGVLRLALPLPAAPVVDLKIAFLGSLDLAAGLLAFDASLYDSRIGVGDFSLSLEGDVAIRISWGARPDLVASLGGFHPAYRPAAHLKLPAMRRITLSLLRDNPRITLSLYMAVTSNTVQFGARLELYVGVAGFSVAGDLGFDVLVQIAPFLIDARMWARLAVRAGSVDICSLGLDLRLVGPTPWIASGTASFKILFISISVEVEARLGEERATTLPGEAVLPRVLEALGRTGAWSSELDPAASPGVTLVPPAPDELVVDAAGRLSVRQDLIPLATDIGLVGVVPPTDVDRVTITGWTFGADGAQQFPVVADDVTAGYAPSTFAGAPTADTDRLKAASFVQRPTGKRAQAGAGLVGDLAVAHQVAYERIVIDDPDAPAPPKVLVQPAVSIATLVAGGAVGGSAGARRRRALAERGTVRPAVTVEPRFAVTALDDLHPLDDGGRPLVPDASGALPTYALVPRPDAEARLRALTARDGPRYQIVPEVQVVRS